MTGLRVASTEKKEPNGPMKVRYWHHSYLKSFCRSERGRGTTKANERQLINTLHEKTGKTMFEKVKLSYKGCIIE